MNILIPIVLLGLVDGSLYLLYNKVSMPKPVIFTLFFLAGSTVAYIAYQNSAEATGSLGIVVVVIGGLVNLDVIRYLERAAQQRQDQDTDK